MQKYSLLLLLALAACNYGTPIYLKNPLTDEIVVCGPYPYASTAAADEAICLKKAESTGYVRVRN